MAYDQLYFSRKHAAEPAVRVWRGVGVTTFPQTL